MKIANFKFRLKSLSLTILTSTIYISFPLLMLGQECGINPPKSAEECVNYFTDAYCCYLANESTTMCKLIPAYDYEWNMKKYIVDKVSYNVTCLLTSENGLIGTYCGKETSDNDSSNIFKSTDCTSFSVSDNDCCYYKNHLTNFTRCFWLGVRFSNEIIQNIEEPNTTLTCGVLSQMITADKKIILLLVLILILL